jgi:hypothetical protein
MRTPLSQELMDEKQHEIRWDVAWQIFDEINEGLH